MDYNIRNCFFLLLIVFTFPLFGCGGGEDQANPFNVNFNEDLNTTSESDVFTVSYAIKDTSSNPTTDFTLGDDVIVELTMINISDEYQGITFNGQDDIDHEVYDETGLIKLFDGSYYDNPSGVVSIIYYSFPSESSTQILMTWNGIDNSGNLLSPGSYILKTTGNLTDYTTKQIISFTRYTKITLH